jgi:hypothetical protein
VNDVQGLRGARVVVECTHAAFRPAGRRFGAARAIGEGSGEVIFDERAHVIAALQVVTQSGGTYPIPFSRLAGRSPGLRRRGA